MKHIHMGIKEHVCDICNRNFAFKSTMEDHRKIHTSEKPYSCNVCKNKFTTNSLLLRHMKCFHMEIKDHVL